MTLTDYYYKWLNIYKDCSSVWKQAAKKWRGYTVKWDGKGYLITLPLNQFRPIEAEANTATRLRGLLSRTMRYLDHTEDCTLNFNDQVCDCRLSKLRLELAEELAEAQADEYLESEGAHHRLEDFDDE